VTILKHELDPRAQKVMGFLVGKGLLWTNQNIEPFFGKIMLEDAFWVAENVEPRVYEVLPAAMVHFPKTFIGIQHIPEKLKMILDALQKQKPIEIDEWKGIPIRNIVKWTNRPLKDKRSKPMNQKKQNKTFRLSPEINRKIKELAEEKMISETELLEALVRKAS